MESASRPGRVSRTCRCRRSRALSGPDRSPWATRNSTPATASIHRSGEHSLRSLSPGSAATAAGGSSPSTSACPRIAPAPAPATGTQIDKAGLWSIYVQAISRLFEQLHADPPPINYERRRITAQPATVQAQARRLLPDAKREDRRGFSARLWTLYTGGEIEFAPAPLSDWAQAAEPASSEAIEAAAAALGNLTDEPLVWQPP